MLKTFIERPVLSTVISILIVVLGIIGLLTLPIEQYPNIAPPTVSIQASYPGANAEAVQNSVIVPIEEAVNGVEGMTYMTSNATNAGSASITVYFDRKINPDIASVNVQNMVATATPLLPQEVTRAGVTVRKRQNSTIMMLEIYSESPDYNGLFIQNFINVNILPLIKRIKGVGEASVMGAQDFSMRVWLKPDVMMTYKISPAEVLAALADQNIEAAPGELGQNSNQSFQYSLKFTGKLNTVEQFKNIVLRSQNGQILRLGDVANVELGSISYAVMSGLDGKPGVMVNVNQTAGSNAQEVIADIKKVMKEAEQILPKGINYVYMNDASEFLNASIHKVVETLLEAFLLVFLVVFIFLQDFRSTFIPAIAVPVAIVGTFFFLLIFGFSINLLTLFALVLAIGIVVDDAIVVVEAVHAKLDAGEKSPKNAAVAAMDEIAPAIISITLVMASVFIPVSFLGGTSGVFYKQFGLTLAIAIVISAVNALTLSPSLSALFLKAHSEPGEKKMNVFRRLGHGFNLFFGAGTRKYKSSLQFLGKRGHRWITVAIIAVAVLILVGLMKFIPTGFVPNEDSGGVIAMITLPPGASLERSDSVARELITKINEIENVAHTAKISGINFMAGGLGSSYATVFIKMDNWNERKISTSEVVALLTEKTKPIRNAEFFFAASPTLQGFGMSAGVELQLQDRLNRDINDFYAVSQNFVAEMRKRPEVMLAMNNFNPNFTQLQVDADIPKIKEAGLTLTQVMQTLQIYIGSMYVSNFNLYGKQFRLMLQAAPEYRTKLSDLNGIYVQTGSGEMAPVTEFIKITQVKGPQSRTRFNMFSSISIVLVPNMLQGKSTGDVENAIKEVAAQMLPEGYSYEYSGLAREESNQGNQTILIFGLCLIFIYLLLAALYESYILPLAVIFSLPIGLAGVFIFIFVGLMSGSGIMNNIYVQISLIMLIGLLAKNAILIVEYAVQRRKQGMSIVEAAVNGAVARLRPILMTSLAFIAGLFPLSIASGAGAIGNRSIGLSAIGGMIVGTFIGVLVIPSLYIIFQTIQDKFSKSGLVNSNDELINSKQVTSNE